MTRCTIQAKISLLLESLQNHNTEDALFPHICRIQVIISISIIIVIVVIIIINIIMIMIINDNDVQSASDLLCVTSAWLQHVCKSHVCLLSGIYCPIIILIILILSGTTPLSFSCYSVVPLPFSSAYDHFHKWDYLKHLFLLQKKYWHKPHD